MAMRSVVLDARELNDCEKAHVYLMEKLQLPDYYGGNLDALYDCLTEYGSLDILFIHTNQGGSMFQLLRRVFADAARVNEELMIIDLAE